MPTRIRYKSKLGPVLGLFNVLLFGAISAGIGIYAFNVESKLKSVLLFAGAGMFACITIAIFIGVLRSLGKPRFITLDDKGITAPKSGLSKQMVSVAFAHIKNVEAKPAYKVVVLEITHRSGKLSIPDTMIGGPEELEKLSRLILAGVKNSAAPKSEPAPKPATKPETPNRDPQTEALFHAINEQRKVDPLVGAKLGAKEILQRLHIGMKSEKGVHIESLLCALGALAGYACQANFRAQALAKNMPENAAFQVVETNDGKQYFFGDLLNNALANAQYSVWSLAAAAAQDAGVKEFPDLEEIFKHTSSVIGSAQFGIPRTPENHKAGDTPLNYLKHMWPAFFPTVKQFCPQPVEWPILYGLAIQETIKQGKNIIDPALSLKMVMESAIAMSKVDLGASLAAA